VELPDFILFFSQGVSKGIVVEGAAGNDGFEECLA
jgi:hypothetical protein